MKSKLIYSVIILFTLLFAQTSNADDKAFMVFLHDGTSVQYRLADVDSIVYGDYVPEPTYLNGYEYIDLGLSVKWATCNVGASSPEEAGYYVTWGDTLGYTDYMVDEHSFSWDTYKYCKGSGNSISKYCDNSAYGCVTDEETSSRFTDGQTSLLDEDDAAIRYMGGGWRMPTRAELIELKNNCYWEWTTDYKGTGVAGYIVYKVKAEADKKCFSYDNPTLTGTYTLKDTHIFLPAAGYRRGEGGLDTKNYNKAGVWSYGSFGNYWCIDMKPGEPDKAYFQSFSYNTGGNGITTNYRCYGRSIRAVCNVSEE